MKLRRYLGVALLAVGFFATSAFGQSFYWNTASAQSVALGGVYVPSSSDAIGCGRGESRGAHRSHAPSAGFEREHDLCARLV